MDLTKEPPYVRRLLTDVHRQSGQAVLTWPARFEHNRGHRIEVKPTTSK
jgi:hypothetical protein